jgi:hypothetical protein
MATKTCTSTGEIRHVLQSQAKARALRYDNLGTVLTNLDEQMHKPAKRKRDKDSVLDPTEIAELRRRTSDWRKDLPMSSTGLLIALQNWKSEHTVLRGGGDCLVRPDTSPNRPDDRGGRL